MQYFNEVNAASFRGVPFLLENHSTGGGRKLAVHEFPNQNRRYTEDLGGLKKSIKLVGIITEPNYRLNRDALIRALETPGIGTLIHPFLGVLQVVAEPYVLNEDFSKLGEAVFEMSFLESESNIFPTQSLNNTSLINQLTGGAFESALSAFESAWSVSNQYRINYQNANDLLSTLGDNFKTITNPFNADPNAFAQFRFLLSQFNSNIPSNIYAPSNLGTSIQSLFNSTVSLTNDPRQQFGIYQSFFNYGQDNVLPPNTTFQRQQLIQNNNALTNLINIGGLAQAYDAAVEIDFTNEEDLNSIENQLNMQYDYVIDQSSFDPNTLEPIKNLRNQVRLFFENIRINIRKIELINTQRTTITVLTYAYYNSLDNDSLLLSLNNITNPNNISGDFKIVTEQ